MIDIKGSTILVTGGEGFLGMAICKKIAEKKATPIVLKHKEVNLHDLQATIHFLTSHKPNFCIHAAGYNGGIEFKRMYPADILYSNTVMGLNLHHACEYTGVEKILSIMTSCAYPDTGMDVLKEETFWDGLPNKTIRAHGIAKRILQTASEAYNDQYDYFYQCGDDIKLLKQMDNNAYRFSIEWARIEPQQGVFCNYEIQHYQEKIQYLQEQGIEPVVTMFHFTLPKWVKGWNKKETIPYFVRFARLLFTKFTKLLLIFGI